MKVYQMSPSNLYRSEATSGGRSVGRSVLQHCGPSRGRMGIRLAYVPSVGRRSWSLPPTVPRGPATFATLFSSLSAGATRFFRSSLPYARTACDVPEACERLRRVNELRERFSTRSPDTETSDPGAGPLPQNIWIFQVVTSVLISKYYRFGHFQ